MIYNKRLLFIAKKKKKSIQSFLKSFSKILIFKGGKLLHIIIIIIINNFITYTFYLLYSCSTINTITIILKRLTKNT